MGNLTTHILDTAHGSPAAAVRVELYRLNGESRQFVAAADTNQDGRCDEVLAEGDDFPAGVYELLFHVGDYFRARSSGADDPAFLEIVPIRFGVSAPDQHYHVPLLVSPFGYSTYRGS